MHLSPKDLDKLVLHQAGFVAQKRYARGLLLNYPEALALIATQLLEFIRDGERVAVLMDKGKQLLGLADVLPGGKVSFDLTADAPGDWAFHCHMLYHMHAGMMQVVQVRSAKGDTA